MTPSGFAPASLASAFEAGIVAARAATIESEVYATLDADIAAALRVLPPLACKKGCAGCCFNAPIVTSLEWVILHRHLGGLDEAAFGRVVDAAETIRPLVPRLIAQHHAHVAKESLVPLTVQCPFLLDGACSVYKARPLICRAFGSTLLRDSLGELQYFASELANAHAAQRLPSKLRLPALEPYLGRTRALTAEAKGLSAALPLWLFTHLDGRRLVSDVNLAPDFGALA